MAAMAILIVPMVEEHWNWFQSRTPIPLSESTTGFVALKDGIIAGATVFDGWTHNSCRCHAAIENPLVARRLIRVSVDFIFNYAERNVAIGITPASNERMIKLAKGLGFKEICRIRDGYEVNVDLVLLEARKEELSKWIRPTLKKVA